MQLPPPPSGTRIQLAVDARQCGTIEIPRPRFTVTCAVGIVMVAGFFAFVIAIGLEFSKESMYLIIPFALIFLGVAFLYFGGLVNAMMGRQTIRLTLHEIEIEKTRPFFPRRYAIPYSEIERVVVEKTVPKTILDGFNNFYHYILPGPSVPLNQPISLPTILHRGTRTHFAEAVTNEEKAWLVEIIRTVVSARSANAAYDAKSA